MEIFTGRKKTSMADIILLLVACFLVCYFYTVDLGLSSKKEKFADEDIEPPDGMDIFTYAAQRGHKGKSIDGIWNIVKTLKLSNMEYYLDLLEKSENIESFNITIDNYYNSDKDQFLKDMMTIMASED